MKKKFRIVSMLLTVVLLMSAFLTPVAAGQENGEGQNNLPEKGQVIDNLSHLRCRYFPPV
ncbi:MAG: hypothetical protein KGZ41_04645 [Dethiobacter sp.]|nr:hypothetical protein [Dethiobacter sp.]